MADSQNPGLKVPNLKTRTKPSPSDSVARPVTDVALSSLPPITHLQMVSEVAVIYHTVPFFLWPHPHDQRKTTQPLAFAHHFWQPSWSLPPPDARPLTAFPPSKVQHLRQRKKR